MAVIQPDKFRNIVLTGHTGGGKTSLIEAMLFKAGATKRLGSVNDGTTQSDFLDDEHERKCSLDSSIFHIEHGDCHLNIIDTPGVDAFCGYSIAALASVECAAIVISAASGIQVNTRKAFNRAKRYGLGIMFVINHIDAPDVDLPGILSQLKETFGSECIPVNLPTGGGSAVEGCLLDGVGESDFSSVADTHTEIIEAVVGADDDLMEKYLGGELDEAEAFNLAPQAVASGLLIPIVFSNACADVGVTEFLNTIVRLCPSPVNGKKRSLVNDEKEEELHSHEAAPFVGQVFKVSTDYKSHIKYLSVRVHSGKLTPDMSVKTAAHPKGMRPGHIVSLQGSEHKEIEAATAGNIVALAKLDFHVGDVIYADEGGKIAMPVLPKPMYSLAVESKSRGDEDKIGAALKRFADEDPCFTMDRGAGGETVIHGMGDAQLRTYLTRMDKLNKLQVNTKPPRVAYRETITGNATNIEYTHKKQSGGSGQFGRVIINVLAAERGEGYEFVDKIFGGAIDQSYRPSVDKGIRSVMAEGVLAGYPVVDVKVELIDGKTHPVDSKDIAFQTAGRNAFREGFLKAKPVLLEPIVHIEIIAPAENVGDIQGDLASRRGRPQGQDVLPGNMACIKAQIPLSEVSDYNSRLSSITGGQGSYDMDFSHYETVPSNVQQQIVDKHKKELEEAAAG